jgi:hypothetical protein
MDDLVVTKLPGRSGLYLAIQNGATIETIARFTKGAESATKFVDWCVQAGIKYEKPTDQEGE